MNGRTGIAGLYACGEVASTGLHGANRLGSNSLLEALVMGWMTGQASAGEMDAASARELKKISIIARVESGGNGLDITDMRNSLRSLMNRHAGIERTAAGLEDAKQALDSWSSYVMEREFGDVRGWELQNMLTVSRLIVEAALARCESRGAHHRLDYPEKLDEWERHLTIRCAT